MEGLSGSRSVNRVCDLEVNGRFSGLLIYGAVAQFGRALRSQCRGRGFESPPLHSIESCQTVGPTEWNRFFQHRTVGIWHVARSKYGKS